MTPHQVHNLMVSQGLVARNEVSDEPEGVLSLVVANPLLAAPDDVGVELLQVRLGHTVIAAQRGKEGRSVRSDIQGLRDKIGIRLVKKTFLGYG